MPTAAKVELALLTRIVDDPDWAKAETKRVNAYNEEHGAVYGEDPIPVSLKPNLITPQQETLLEHASQHLTGALNAFVHRFLESPRLQDAWNITSDELALCQVDPGYEDAVQIARFDGFLHDESLSFLEFNCDSPGGAGYGDVIQEAFQRVLEHTPHLLENARITHTPHLDPLADTLLDCYAQWRQSHPQRPTNPHIVLTDWPTVGSRPDIDITVQRFQQRGLDATFADPRDLDLDGDELMHEGERVDVVYKRVITHELLEDERARALLEAYKNETVCMVNPPRSVIVGNKKIMSALTSQPVLDAMGPQQRRAVHEHIPWTSILEDATVQIEGLSVNLRDMLLDNKDAFVLKPAKGYGGKDVHLGIDTDPTEWGRLVDAHIDTGDWVTQRLATIPKGLYPRTQNETVELETVNVNVNPFVFNGRYAGSYTRISPQNVINVSHGGGLVPTFTVHED